MLYSGIVFFVLIQFAIFFPVPESTKLFSDDLISAPLSYRSHLLYLESLTVKNRLEEAQHESDFLHIGENVLNPSPVELAELNRLENSITSRKIVFHTTSLEYDHWSAVLKTNPDFRDGLYLLAQRAYMIYDDQTAAELLKQGIELDPQFEEGKRVLRMMWK